MKVLILILGFFSIEIHAVVDVSDKALTTTFVSTIQDGKIQGQIQESAEFTKCREEALKKKKGGSPQAIATEAAICIKTQLKDPEKAKALAENLRLVEFGLTPSKNLRDVTEYIGNKMYKSLTGVDLNDPVEKFMESTKFKNKTQIDQGDFFVMYKSQLAKNALFLVSAFCFNDLRLKSSAGKDTFTSHWHDYFQNPNINYDKDLSASGIPAFTVDADETDKSKIYKNLEAGVGSFNSDQITKFHTLCTSHIVPLCSQGEGKACILQKKLQGIRKAFADSEKAWAEYSKSNSKSYLKDLKTKIYDSSQARKEDSIDSITTMASNDFLQKVEKDKELDDCATQAELPKCEAYLSDTTKTVDAVNNMGINLAFETEIKRSRVAEFENKKDEQGLKDYLKANGYLDIVERMDPNHPKTIAMGKIAEAVGEIYENRRNEAIKVVHDRLGKRQANETQKDKEAAAQFSASEFKQEKMRLAQVVLFNNVITSQLELEKDMGNGKKESAGRNTSGLDKEIAELENNSIDTKVFKGLKGKDGPSPASSSSGNSISNIDFVDGYLGAKPKSP